MTALHFAAEGKQPAVAALLGRRVDPEVEDRIHHSTAAGRAERFGHPAAAEYPGGR